MRRQRLALILVGLTLLSIGYMGLRAWDRFIGNGPARLYGKVVDGDGTPLPDVRVTATIRSVSRRSLPLTPAFSITEVVVTTDREGRFSIQSSRARFLSIRSFDKPGWEPKNGLVGIPTSFEYPLMGYEYPPGARKRPDNPDDPIVYPMVPVKVATSESNPN